MNTNFSFKKFAIVAALGLAGGALYAQQFTPGAKIEGGWLRTDSSGSGYYENLTNGFAKAQLTPDAAARLANMGGRAPVDFQTGGGQQIVRGEFDPRNQVQHAAGQAYLAGNQFPCRFNGGAGGGLEHNSAAFFMIADKDQVIEIGDGGGGRIIYMDGRKHPDPTNWIPTGAGHAVGHYENGMLVVDVVGMTAGPVTAGGWRTPETHLTEKFIPSADGKHMTISYTWEDPKIYVKPHTYQYTFDALPGDATTMEGWCDASDPRERQSVIPPNQN